MCLFGGERLCLRGLAANRQKQVQAQGDEEAKEGNPLQGASPGDDEQAGRQRTGNHPFADIAKEVVCAKRNTGLLRGIILRNKTGR